MEHGDAVDPGPVTQIHGPPAPVPPAGHAPVEGFRHDALVYDGLDAFLDGTAAFVEDGLRAREPVLVVVSPEKIRLLRSALGPRPEHELRYVDMERLGRNPARIIPAWRDFLDGRPEGDGPVRGVGEPMWPGRTADELPECFRHEQLLNLAFADTPGWWLLCPYDASALEPSVLDEARRSHPFVVEGGERRPSPTYPGLDALEEPFADRLTEPPPGAPELAFAGPGLEDVRTFVSRVAELAGLSPARVPDLVVAVNEVATNSIRHGGGGGRLRAWSDDGRLVCEVRDRGVVDEPLAGRLRPLVDAERGLGLWLVNQLCELVQIRSSSEGTVVRLHMELDAQPA